MEKIKCDFCNKEFNENEMKFFYSNDNNKKICFSCLINTHLLMIQNGYISLEKLENNFINNENKFEKIKFYSPLEIKKELDNYVINQEMAKKVLSVAISNHYNKLNFNINNEDIELEKSNLLLIGPTGSGKTLLVERLAKFLNLPLAIADATTLTEAGYAGDDVDSILKKLLNKSNGNIELAEKGIVFIDEIDKISKKNFNNNKDVNGEGVQQALLKMIEGTEISFVPGNKRNPIEKEITINTKDILFICSGSFDGLNEIIKKRLKLNQKKIGFDNNNNIVYKEENLLYDQIENEDLIEYGLIPEFVGRLHNITYLNKLNKEDLIKIIIEPKNSIFKQYKKLFEINGIYFNISKKGLELIAENSINKNTGARGLRSVFEKITLNYLFDISKINNNKLLLNERNIKEFIK